MAESSISQALMKGKQSISEQQLKVSQSAVCSLLPGEREGQPVFPPTPMSGLAQAMGSC